MADKHQEIKEGMERVLLNDAERIVMERDATAAQVYVDFVSRDGKQQAVPDNGKGEKK